MKEDLLDAYFAGFIDGEGCIRINRSRQKNDTILYNIYCIIVNTDLKPLLLAQKHFGLGCVNRGDLKYGHKKQPYRWTVSSNACCEVLKRVLPYAITKRKEMLLALKFQQHIRDTKLARPGDGHTDATRRYRQKCYEEMRDLKQQVLPRLTPTGPY